MQLVGASLIRATVVAIIAGAIACKVHDLQGRRPKPVRRRTGASGVSNQAGVRVAARGSDSRLQLHLAGAQVCGRVRGQVHHRVQQSCVRAVRVVGGLQ